MLCLGHRFTPVFAGEVQVAGARMQEMREISDLYEGEATSLHHSHSRRVPACSRMGYREVGTGQMRGRV